MSFNWNWYSRSCVLFRFRSIEQIPRRFAHLSCWNTRLSSTEKKCHHLPKQCDNNAAQQCDNCALSSFFFFFFLSVIFQTANDERCNYPVYIIIKRTSLFSSCKSHTRVRLWKTKFRRIFRETISSMDRRFVSVSWSARRIKITVW